VARVGWAVGCGVAEFGDEGADGRQQRPADLRTRLVHNHGGAEVDGTADRAVGREHSGEPAAEGVVRLLHCHADVTVGFVEDKTNPFVVE